MDDPLVVAIRARLREERLPCAEAFALAQERHMAPMELAAAAEAQGIRIGWCQLGLFVGARKGKGWPAEPLELAEEVRALLRAAAPEGRLSCVEAWALARRLEWERLALGYAANTLDIRIVRCQLGCFP